MDESESQALPDLRELRRKGEFGEYMLVSWGYVEALVDLFVWDAFHVPANDEASDLFFDLLCQVRFEWKIVTLKHLKTVTNDEYKAIHTLQQSRNKLFHFSGEEFGTLFADKKKREQMMNEADEATNVCSVVLQRRHPELVKELQSARQPKIGKGGE